MYLPGTVQKPIKDLYTNTGLTQNERADIIYVEPSQLSRIGTGRTQRVSNDILIKLAKALNVSTYYIPILTFLPTTKNSDVGYPQRCRAPRRYEIFREQAERI